MKKLSIILLCLFTAVGYSQNTPLTFTPITTDFVAPGRGAELWGTTDWDNTNVPYVPSGNSTAMNSYQRFVWGQIETAQGVYSWTDMDGYFQRAITKGQMFELGVMTLCSSCSLMPTYGYPTYLHNLMQAEATNSKDWNYTGNGYNMWIPNWNSPNFIARLQAFNTALAAHIANSSYNGVPFSKALYTVDIRGYGDFGEWHTYPWVGTEPTGRAATSASLKAIVDAVKTAFPNTQLMIPMAAFDTDPGHSSRLPADFGYYVLTTSNNRGQIGWRRDNYGDPDYNDWLTASPGQYNPGDSVHHFSPLILNKYKYAPISGEPNNGLAAVSTCGSPYCDLLNEFTMFHTSQFGNGNYPGLKTTNTAFVNNILAASKIAGYRIQLTGGTMTTTLASNSSFNISLNLQNLGLAPTYEDWNIVYELRNASNTVVWTGTSSFPLRLFLPSTTATTISDNFNLGTVANGTYNLLVLVKDPNGYKKPMPLAISGRNADGSYSVRTGISVITGGSAFTVNAGTDQSLTVGTTSTTLNGSIADTTIGQTYTTTWSKVSGPAATITNPTKRSTTVTGMVSGVYVFRMTVVSSGGTTITDDIQVTIVGNVSPVAQISGAGPITLPTNSIIVNGNLSSDADGTIAAYLWSNVSGPNTPTITSSSVATTTFTGLIQGTYVIRLTVTDDMGATGTTTATVIVNPVAGPATNIFTTQTPTSLTTENDGGPLEVGVKFRASVSGAITGLRFYKTTGNSGTHTGELYSSAGVRLASAVFSGETSSGWQSVTFSSPVAISANTTYIAAYYSSAGNYISTANYFGSAVVNNPLTALAEGTDGSNGVFLLTSTPAFPNQTYQSSNYWVDIIFTANLPPTASITGSSTIQLPANSTTFAGGGSTDPDGTIVSYTWTSTAGPNTPNFTSVGANTTVNGLIAGTYTIKLTVTDNLGASASTTKSLVVLPQAPPTSFIIGIGSGTISMTSMTGHNPGDTLYIRDGTYTGGILDNLVGLIIRPLGTRTFFTGSVEFRNNKFCDWGYATWTSFSGQAVDVRNYSGNINNCTFHNMAFFNGTGGPCFNANSGSHYTYGDTTTHGMYKVKFDSIYEKSCIQFIQGSFGSPADNSGAPPSTACKIIVKNFVSEGTTATTGEGTEIRGIFWEADFGNWKVTSTTQRNASGDDGLIYGYFSGNFHEIYKNGGPGYIFRGFPSAQLSRPDSINIWNCAKINSTDYGLANVQWSDANDSVAGKFGNVQAVNIYNNTLVNAPTSITYWCQIAVIGVRGWPRYQFRNNLGVNISTTGKPEKLIYNMGEPWVNMGNDTSNNRYYTSATSAFLDSTTVMIGNALGNFTKYRPTSSSGPIIDGGTTNPLTAVDFDGVARSATGDIGYLEGTTGNINPVAQINASGSIILPTTSVVLDGSGSSDQDGTVASYLWSKTSGPAGSSFTSTTASSTTVNGLVVGTYVFQLQVTDNLGAHGTLTKTIVVSAETISDILIFRKAAKRIYN